MRCANGKLLDLKQCSAFIIIVTRYSTPACCCIPEACMLYVFLKLLHFPWCQAMITPRYLMTLWWSQVHQSRWKHCYLCTCTAHIARHHSSNIDGNNVVVLRKYCCQCSNIGQISLWKDAQLLRDITRPILTKGFLSQTTGFAAWRRDYANVDRLHSGQRLKAMIVTENSTEKDLKIFRNSGSQQWPSTIFMCAKSFTFPRNFPRR